MVTKLEWFQKAFYNIIHDKDVINNLSDIKIALASMNSNQLRYTASNMNLNTIFDCLNSSARNQIELAVQVLKILLNALDSTIIISQYGESMVRAIKHPNCGVKELVLTELNRAACQSDLVLPLSQELDLMLSVVECVGHEESAVARPSIKFLTSLGTTITGLEALYSTRLLQALNKVGQTNDTNRFRVYEVAVEVSSKSQRGLEASHTCGILEQLLLELKKDDVLVLLTTLEFITNLALTQHGYSYLESHGVVIHLAKQIANVEFNPLSALVLPGLIKFFGNVAQLRPQETFRDYPKVIETIFRVAKESDQNLACVALETIGYIATTSMGKQTLQKQGGIMKGIMDRISEIIQKWPSESRVRGMNVLANLIKLELSEQDTEMLATVQMWFDSLGPQTQTMAQVKDMGQQPFPEIKLAVLFVLLVLSEQPWSQQYINNTPGLIELLLNRSLDSTMQEKSARLAVINALAESPTSESIFGEEMVKKFEKFVKEGVVYVQLQTEVAIEDAN